MANNITTYLENKLLEHSVGKAPYTMPTTYVGLFINSPTVNYLTPNSITGTEVGQTNGYERKLISWNSASSGTISNSTDVTWTSTGPWSSNSGSATPVGYIGVFDNASQLLWFGSLSAKILMAVSGDTFTLPAGSLTLTLT
jgi:hypothetical protein